MNSIVWNGVKLGNEKEIKKNLKIHTGSREEKVCLTKEQQQNHAFTFHCSIS